MTGTSPLSRHDAPASITVIQAHAAMQEHLRCDTRDCPHRQAALASWSMLAATSCLSWCGHSYRGRSIRRRLASFLPPSRHTASLASVCRAMPSCWWRYAPAAVFGQSVRSSVRSCVVSDGDPR
jgi:hypothetical protein